MAYDASKAKQICDLIAENDLAKNMMQACALVGVAPSTFLSWCDKPKCMVETEEIDAQGNVVLVHQRLSEAYAHASNISVQLQFEDFERLNDEQPWTNARGQVDIGWTQYHRTRMDNKKWALAKRHPTKYGEKVEHTGKMQVEHSIDRTALLNRLTETAGDNAVQLAIEASTKTERSYDDDTE